MGSSLRSAPKVSPIQLIIHSCNLSLTTWSDTDHLVCIIDYESGDYQDITLHSDLVSAVAFNPNASVLASASDAEIALFDVRVSEC